MDSGFPGASRLELVQGELIDHLGRKRPHVILLSLIGDWLRAVFGAEKVETKSPTDVAETDNAHSEPEPALKLLCRPSRNCSSNPLPQDRLLVVEISDSTLPFDLTVKAALYARAEIVEYWTVDIPHRKMHVHRDPSDGVYQHVVTYGFKEAVTPLAAPDARFCEDRL